MDETSESRRSPTLTGAAPGPAATTLAAPGAPPARSELAFLAVAAASALLWQVPHGNWLLYPVSILATWFHEMGHGLMAILLGGDLERLRLFSDGSGVAEWRASADLGRLARAAIAAGGPLGPPVAGSLFILAGRSRRAARVALWLLGAALALSALLYVRTFFGVVVILLWAAAVLAAALWAKPWAQGLAIQFLGVQACVSTFQHADYLFRGQAVIGGEVMWSDTGQIARALWLPHWFWGAAIAILATAMLAASLWLAYRDLLGSAGAGRRAPIEG